jgi:MtN3 and saliva related transmembrane protein
MADTPSRTGGVIFYLCFLSVGEKSQARRRCHSRAGARERFRVLLYQQPWEKAIGRKYRMTAHSPFSEGDTGCRWSEGVSSFPFCPLQAAGAMRCALQEASAWENTVGLRGREKMYRRLFVPVNVMSPFGEKAMSTELSAYVGYPAAFLTTIAFVPQAWKSWRTRDLSGVSLPMYALFTAGVALWLAYGLLIGSLPVILANTVTLLLAMVVLLLKLAERQAGPGR